MPNLETNTVTERNTDLQFDLRETLDDIFVAIANQFFTGEDHLPLNEVVLNYEPGKRPSKTGRTTYGVFHQRWIKQVDKDKEAKPSISLYSNCWNINDDAKRKAMQTIETMHHEMIHLYNFRKKVTDCAKGGRHNKAFKQACLDHGLTPIEMTPSIGWGTSLDTESDAWKAWAETVVANLNLVEKFKWAYAHQTSTSTSKPKLQMKCLDTDQTFKMKAAEIKKFQNGELEIFSPYTGSSNVEVDEGE